MSKYDVAAVRKRLQEKQGNRFKDANEFRPPKNPDDNKTVRIRFYVLPPLTAGDKCADGVASESMDMFYVQNGAHWINNRTHPCPRVHEDEEECPLCQLGFDLMGETDVKDERRAIAKQWLPRTQYAVNVYFPKDKVNPEELAGKVMWMNASKQVFDIWEACIMNDEEGDPADPQAYGVFYDENDSYCFQLEIGKNGDWNSYKTSKFLANVGKRPMARDKDNKALPKRIEAILSQRHDLFTKFGARDPEALAALAKQMLSGEPKKDDDAGFDSDDTKTEAAAEESVEETVDVVDEVVEDSVDEAVEEEAVEEDSVDEAAGFGEDAEDAKEAKKEDKAAGAGDDIEDNELQDLLAEIESDD